MYALSYKRISEENGRNTIGISQGVPLDVSYVFFTKNAYTFETVSSTRLFLSREGKMIHFLPTMTVLGAFLYFITHLTSSTKDMFISDL